MTARNDELERLSDELYERYGKPLEAKHAGQYLAISPEGKTFFDHDLFNVANTATETFGPGNFIYKVGEKTICRI